jgi:CxxC motif-containing protein (DUF1111 family)
LIGIGNPVFPAPNGDCTVAQPCHKTPNGNGILNEPEVSEELLRLVTFYASNLAVPARREVNHPTVLRGKQLFYKAGCASCHAPKFVTRRDSQRPYHSFQLIWPYTDLLLHDMGEGLADELVESEASGREWRTAPLWGIGLTPLVNGHSQLLHDGRARNVLEAILWHGGEAEAAKRQVLHFNKEDRQALSQFVESL